MNLCLKKVVIGAVTQYSILYFIEQWTFHLVESHISYFWESVGMKATAELLVLFKKMETNNLLQFLALS